MKKSKNAIIMIYSILMVLLISFSLGTKIPSSAMTNKDMSSVKTSTKTMTEKNFANYNINSLDYTSAPIRVDFFLDNSPNQGPYLIRGIKYTSYQYDGYSSHIKVTFKGDSKNVSYFDVIPYTSGWKDLLCGGDVYLVDDDPQVLFHSEEESLRMHYDDGISGNSYMWSGGIWALQTHEYFMELYYEWILNLNLHTCMSGDITAIDNVDAYFIDLTADQDYRFSLKVGTGSGNIRMRIVSNQELTDDTLMSATCYPTDEVDPSDEIDEIHALFTPETTDTYILLVEAEDASSDINGYNVYYTEVQPDTFGGDPGDDDPSVSDDNPFIQNGFPWIEIIAILALISITIPGILIWRRKRR